MAETIEPLQKGDGEAPALILASGSAIRAQILRQAGLVFVQRPAAVDEQAIKDSLRAEGADAASLADTLAEMKARRIAQQLAAATDPPLVLGCDQVLACDGEWFDKPHDQDGARAHLHQLSGREHRLISAAVIVQGENRIWGHHDQASLHMRPLSDDFVTAYLDAAGDDVCASVGAYQLEGLGAQLFDRIDGNYFTILGLPLLPLLGFLRGRGVLWA